MWGEGSRWDELQSEKAEYRSDNREKYGGPLPRMARTRCQPVDLFAETSKIRMLHGVLRREAEGRREERKYMGRD